MLEFYVNGEKHRVENPEPDHNLITYLRSKGLTGTKLGCGEGGCGACTVLLQHFQDGQIVNRAVNSCLYPLCGVHQKQVITVEGIGSYETMLHPIQKRIAEYNGSQCGFCTPGIVMSLYALMRNNPKPTVHEVEGCLDGNLCRCTGYRPILEAARSFACCNGKECCEGKSCEAKDEKKSQKICPSSGMPCDCPSQGKPSSEDEKSPSPTTTEFPTQPIFPAELRKPKQIVETIKGTRCSWYSPRDMKTLLEIIADATKNKTAVKFYNGATELAIEMNVLNREYPILISTREMPEFYEIQLTKDESALSIGSSVSLTKIILTIKELMKLEASKGRTYRVRNLEAALTNLKYFASTPIRNVASIGGNICTASPISDLNPIWVALGAKAVIVNATTGKERTVSMADKFFVGYRKTIVEADEVLLRIEVPMNQSEREIVGAYKQARRREDDIAIVNGCIFMEFETEKLNVVKKASIVYGGMWITPRECPTATEFIKGKQFDNENFTKMIDLILKDCPLEENAPGGMSEYRRALTVSFFLKYFNLVQMHRKLLPAEELSSVITPERPLSVGTQNFDIVPRGTSVGKPLNHRTAHVQVTGEAQYCDDIPAYPNELQGYVLLSNVAHADIVSIDASEALKVEGVVDFISAKDVQGSNKWASVGIYDAEIMKSETITSTGQIVGMVIANDRTVARLASKLVKVETKEKPAIFSIKEAIKANSFFDGKKEIRKGNPEEAFKNCDFVKEGHMYVGGQEHFYLEPNAALAVPLENHEMLVYSSTQALTHTQHVIADALGVPMNKVVSKIKRIGGGFGGKESQSIPFAAVTAVAAKKLRRPIRLVVDRQQDMASSGQRHPFYGEYKVGFNKDGKIVALSIKIYNNGGYSIDLSLAVNERAVFHIDNCYNIPNLHVLGRVCKTNLPSNTAFRGFGGPQGMMITEHIIDHVAHTLNQTPEAIRSFNLYAENDETHFGQKLVDCHLRRLWDDVKKISNYDERIKSIEKFNSTHRYRKRGLSIIPTKFGIAFTALFLNQGGALVHCYNDGSVLLTHGGTEMGQGLHTKLIQVAATTLGVPTDTVFIAETSTDKIPNTSATAASVGSDLYGMAVQNACLQINERLAALKKELGTREGSIKDWKALCSRAYFERINLSAQGFYATPGLSMDWETGRGNPFSYFSFGTCASEVEIDCLTGDHVVIRSDIVMDVGASLNPWIDIGQIEGAFTQGYGLFMLEELVRGDLDHTWIRPSGRTLTNGPGNYKIPSFNDVPLELNVHLLPNAPNKRAVQSSKAIGEPPLFLASSIFFAAKNAIRAYRSSLPDEKESGDYLSLFSPLTCERIRMGCADDLTRRVVNPDSFLNYQSKASF